LESFSFINSYLNKVFFIGDIFSSFDIYRLDFFDFLFLLFQKSDSGGLLFSLGVHERGIVGFVGRTQGVSAVQDQDDH